MVSWQRRLLVLRAAFGLQASAPSHFHPRSPWPHRRSRAPCPPVCEQLRKAKKDCGPYDKPDTVKTHLRDMLIMPEMIGSVIGVHNGKLFTSVEVKADMVGMYLAEFSISYKPVRHGRPGIGATSSSKFVPLK
jgi:small subunit ribosomal protein S15e